jgi:hypothetical protein
MIVVSSFGRESPWMQHTWFRWKSGIDGNPSNYVLQVVMRFDDGSFPWHIMNDTIIPFCSFFFIFSRTKSTSTSLPISLDVVRPFNC